MINFKAQVWGWLTAVGLLVAAGAAKADAPQATRAARLTYSEGYVHIDRMGTASEATADDPAQLNMPLMDGQTVVTGENGQAEVEFEDGSLARLTPNSSLVLAHLTTDGAGNFNTQLILGRGLAYFELRSAPGFTYSVAAGADRITPVENTTVRVNLDEPPAAVAVLDGTAHVERTGSYAADVRTGETFRGDVSEAGRYFLTREIAADSWDQWNESRDQMAADAASQNTAVRNGYAGTQGYGWSDLDANGRWYDVPGQEPVWQPAGGDAADFDPYGNGSWVWYPTAGYVWASAYPWGWTPFRCGGWSYWNTFGWGWTPNAGCGVFGYAGFGYGWYGGYGGRLNILLPPLRYVYHRPTPGRGGIHPILAVHAGSVGLRPAVAPSGMRTIAGVVARPLNPVGAAYTARGGSAVGSSLRRDYPVDRATRTPVLGVMPGEGGLRQGFVSGARQGTLLGRPSLGSVPGAAPGVTIYGQRPVPSNGMRPNGYPAQGTTYARPNVQSAPRSQPQYSAPRPAAPAMSAPRPMAPPPAAALHTAPSGSGKR